MIRLAAFDMAGTTVNDGGAVYDALQRAVEETGATVAPRDLQTWMGAEKRAALRALIELGGGEATDELVDHAYERFTEILDDLYTQHPPVAIDGAEAMFQALRDRDIRVALTTGFSEDVANRVLSALGWTVGRDGTVDALVAASEVAAGRPAPYMIHRAMERTGVERVDEVLVAGDTRVDVEAGDASGAAIVVGVLSGKAGADAFEGREVTVLDSVAEIPALLDQRAN